MVGVRGNTTRFWDRIPQARIQRGGGGPGVRTPLRFARGGVLCRGLTGRRGGPTIVFTLLLSIFFPARFARHYYTNIYVFILPSSMLSMERSSFLYTVSLIQIMKKNQLSIPCFYEWSYFLTRITQFYTI